MKTQLQKTAEKHELDETMYVRLTEDPQDDTIWVFETGNDKTQLLFGDSEMVVGVYQLVGVERVKRAETHITEKLA